MTSGLGDDLGSLSVCTQMGRCRRPLFPTRTELPLATTASSKTRLRFLFCTHCVTLGRGSARETEFAFLIVRCRMLVGQGNECMKRSCANLILMVVCISHCTSASAEQFLRLEPRGRIELKKSKGQLNLNGVWTIELWVRIDGSSAAEISLLGDDCWKGMSPHLPVQGRQGWGLRLRAVENVNQRRLEMVVAATRPRQNTAEWLPIQSQPLTMPDKPEWSHIAIVKQAQGVTIFLDGQPVVVQSTVGYQFHPAPTALYLGVREFGAPMRRSGFDIASFRITDRIRYTRRFKPQQEFKKDGRTALLLDFGVGQGDVVPDVSGGGHHGTIAGGKWLSEP